MANLRFYFQPMMLIFAGYCLLEGGLWMWVSPVLIFGSLSCVDELFQENDDFEADQPSDLPLFITIVLFILVWLLFLVVVGYSFQNSGGYVPLDLTAFAGLLEPQPVWALLGGVWTIGMLGTAICNIAHEFAHRLTSPVRMFIGQWLLGFALHTSLPIEHIFGHHKNAGFYDDPVSAHRGEGFWMFLVRSFSGTYRNAFAYEKHRLQRQGKSHLSLKNKAFIGYLMQLCLFAIGYALSGAAGVIALTIAAIVSSVILEQFQYISHYGLTRIQGTPMKAYHSWDFSRLGSNSFMFNQTRHSDHHLSARKEYGALDAVDDTVSYPYSPILMLVIVLIPPLFRKITASELERWDREYATDEERAFISGYMNSKTSGISFSDQSSVPDSN
ncbi:MAG: fatty acid desaturase [Hyphomicrobiales bacterium]